MCKYSEKGRGSEKYLPSCPVTISLRIDWKVNAVIDETPVLETASLRSIV